MPEAAKLALTAALAIALAAALLCPPPARRRPGAVASLALAGCGIYLAAALAGLAGHAGAATALAAPGVAALAAAGWLMRAPDDRRGDDEPEPEPDMPIDWDEFDRLRAEWERTTVRPLAFV